jgi:hypothetical protein
LRRALASRDKGCRFPGCMHVRYVDGHHVRHWVDGGETKLSNLVSLCRFHHRAVHEGRFVVQRLDDGAWRFSKPNGQALDVLSQDTRPLDGAGARWRGQGTCAIQSTSSSSSGLNRRLTSTHVAAGGTAPASISSRTPALASSASTSVV